MVTIDRLKELLHYDPESGLFHWIKPRQGCPKNKPAGNLDGVYIRIRIDGNNYRAHRLAWLYCYGTFPSNEIDHINGNKSDNSIKNLREATHQQNMFNKGKTASNKSGFKGAYYIPKLNKWRATCKVNGVKHHIGLFDSPEGAHLAYIEYASNIHGDFFRA